MATATSKTSDNSTVQEAPVQSTKRPPMWKVWFIASRPHTLTASVAPCLMGYTMCRTILTKNDTKGYDHHNNNQLSLSVITLLWMTFCFGIQLATNLHNDYADFVRGADTKDRVGQARATQRGWLTPTATATGATTCLSIASMVGFYLWMQIPMSHDRSLAATMLCTSCFNTVAYTGGPYPLGYIGLEWVSIAYSGLGDIFSYVYFGFVATLMIPYLYHTTTTGDGVDGMVVDWSQLVLLTIPIANIVTAILVVNNVRDRHQDVLADKRTLAVRFGATFCRIEYTIFLFSSYLVMILYNVMHNNATQGVIYAFLPFLSLPMAVSLVQSVWKLEGAALNPFVGKTAQLQLLFCILQCTSMYLHQKTISEE